MSRMKLILSAFAAVFALGAFATSVASATAGWMVNGTLLSGSKALATTAKTDENAKLSGAGLVITCSGATLNSTSPQITSPNKGSASKLEFTSCVAAAPCALAKSTITTLPVSSETTGESASATTTIFKPTTGTTFSTIAVEGETCAAAGNVVINGQEKVLSPEGQVENTLQLIKSITAEASKELFIGKTAASLSGSSLLKLASGERWSFLCS
jgi:hypothetical protein